MKIGIGVFGVLGVITFCALGQFAPAKVRDPWRVINGHTNAVLAAGGIRFEGKVLQVHHNGVRILGKVGSAAEDDDDQEFIVVNFPYEVAENDSIGSGYDLFAVPNGTETYTTVNGASRTLHKLEYGRPCAAPPTPPPDPAEVAAAKAASERKQSEADTATFKFHERQARAGNAGSQYRLGQLYLEGKGVNADTNQAKIWFKKAADQGDEEAAGELKLLETGKD